MLAAKTLVTDLTDDTSRAHFLGRVAVAYSVGAAIGPTAGGILKDLAPTVSAIGSLISIFITWKWIEDIRYNHISKVNDKEGGKNSSLLKEIIAIVKNSRQI
jgi:MFS family permease